jgi:protein gp37
MGDMFDPQVKQEWRDAIYNKMRDNRKHQYFILTKQPARIDDEDLQGLHCYGVNVFLGVSVNNNTDLTRINILRDKKRRSEEKTSEWGHANHLQLFVSFEPLLGDVGKLNLKEIDLIIIGGQSGPKPFYPKKSWVDNIKRQAKEAGIPVYLKKNLRGKSE